MLCCVIPLLLMVALRKVSTAARPVLGREDSGTRAMPPAARRTVVADDAPFAGAAR